MKFEKYENRYGLKINKACFSCRFHGCGSLENERKCDLDGENHHRLKCCRHWMPEYRYERLGSGLAPSGTILTLGRVKRPEYLHWVAETNFFKLRTPSVLRQKYKEEHPGVSIFW